MENLISANGNVTLATPYSFSIFKYFMDSLIFIMNFTRTRKTLLWIVSMLRVNCKLILLSTKLQHYYIIQTGLIFWYKSIQEVIILIFIKKKSWNFFLSQARIFTNFLYFLSGWWRKLSSIKPIKIFLWGWASFIYI